MCKYTTSLLNFSILFLLGIWHLTGFPVVEWIITAWNTGLALGLVASNIEAGNMRWWAEKQSPWASGGIEAILPLYQRAQKILCTAYSVALFSAPVTLFEGLVGRKFDAGYAYAAAAVTLLIALSLPVQDTAVTTITKIIGFFMGRGPGQK